MIIVAAKVIAATLSSSLSTLILLLSCERAPRESFELEGSVSV